MDVYLTRCPSNNDLIPKKASEDRGQDARFKNTIKDVQKYLLLATNFRRGSDGKLKHKTFFVRLAVLRGGCLEVTPQALCMRASFIVCLSKQTRIVILQKLLRVIE
ncbi:unnamed protein product [Clavelina lepadiformis]|uniref:Uncharacterized protein n=1 Tax=Clavelina lepadiformis TaxID=159417 RepID=A0ABP0F936_CLALP